MMVKSAAYRVLFLCLFLLLCLFQILFFVDLIFGQRHDQFLVSQIQVCRSQGKIPYRVQS